jgi:hypothetical protein
MGREWAPEVMMFRNNKVAASNQLEALASMLSSCHSQYIVDFAWRTLQNEGRSDSETRFEVGHSEK